MINNCWLCNSKAETVDNDHYFCVFCSDHNCPGGVIHFGKASSNDKNNIIKRWNALTPNIQLSIFDFIS